MSEDSVQIGFRGTLDYRAKLQQAALDRKIKVQEMLERAVDVYLQSTTKMGDTAHPNVGGKFNKYSTGLTVESTQELHRLADRAAAVLSTERVAAILCASAGLEKEAHEAPRERSSTTPEKGDIAKRVRKALGIKPSSRSTAPGVREAS